ncbi:MAG TPA: S8 family peptidase, partial [Gemmataceae bacterium]|nr:S8 family peptidase [Gemmataceae bacterium]
MPQRDLRSRLRHQVRSAVASVRSWLSPRRPVSSWNRPLLPRHAYRPAVELLEDRLPPGDVFGLLWLGAPAALANSGTPAAESTPEAGPVTVVQVAPREDRFEQVNQALAAYLADLDHAAADAAGRFQADATPAAAPARENTPPAGHDEAVNWAGVESADALFAANRWLGSFGEGSGTDHAASDVTPPPAAGAGSSDGEPTAPAAAATASPSSAPGTTGPTAPAAPDAGLARAASMPATQANPALAAGLSAASPAAVTASLLPGVANVGAGGASFVFTLAPGQQSDLGRLVALAAASGATVQATPLAGAYEVRGGNLPALQQTFAAQPSVASAAAPVLYHTETLPNDPAVTNGTLWGLTGTNGIQAPAAWNVTTGSTKVIVADIDTGVDYNHPDLYKNVWINQAEIPSAVKARLTDIDGDGLITFWDLNNPINQGVGKITDQNGDGRITAADILAPYKADGTGGWADGISEDGDTAHVDDLVGWNFVANTNNPFDDNSHGTHTAGTIAAVGNNSTGVAGVEWTAQLMPLKFLDSTGTGSDAAAAAALNYAVKHGARVTNNSWGGGYSSTFENAVKDANNAGVLVVAAAGNSGTNSDVTPTYPADLPEANVISVAALDSSGNLASFSNYGATTVDLGAPGVSVYSTVPNNGYAYFSGTSM